jgi:hypothetical protein
MWEYWHSLPSCRVCPVIHADCPSNGQIAVGLAAGAVMANAKIAAMMINMRFISSAL